MAHIKTKIFGIGLSRTGTMSLDKALEILGYKSKHAPLDILEYNSGSLSIKLNKVQDYDALTDAHVAKFYKELDVAYPDSKFILTVREMKSWLKSCEKYFINPASSIDNIHKQLMYDLYNTIKFNKVKFKEAYLRHLDDVLSYFKNRGNDLLIIDICAGEGWEKLCPFLDKPVPDVPFPKLNKTTFIHLICHIILTYLKSALKIIIGGTNYELVKRLVKRNR